MSSQTSKYSSIAEYIDGLALVSIKVNGQEVIVISEDPTKSSKTLYGYVDEAGNEIIPCQYVQATLFKDGYARVRPSHKGVGIIDKKGNEIIPCNKYKTISSFDVNGLAFVGKSNYPNSNGNKYALINLKGEELTPFKYTEHKNFVEGLATVCAYVKKPIGKQFEWVGRYGFINTIGEEVISIKFDKVTDFKDGISFVTIDNCFGAIDKTGSVIVPIKCKSEDEVKIKLSVSKQQDTRLRVIAIIKDNQKKVVGYRIFSESNGVTSNCTVEESYNAFGKWGVVNVVFDKEKNSLVGTENSLERLPIVDSRTLKVDVDTVTILAKGNKNGKVGFKIVHTNGKVQTISESKLLAMAVSVKLANAKVISKGGASFLSAIKGEFKVLDI